MATDPPPELVFQGFQIYYHVCVSTISVVQVFFSTQLLIRIKLSIHELRNKLDSFDGKGSVSQYFYFFTDPKRSNL